jgi:hypothetical protein
MILLLYYLIFYDKKYSTKINNCIDGERKPSNFAASNVYPIHIVLFKRFFGYFS